MSLNLVITMMDRDRRESMEAIFKSVGLPMSLTMLGRGTATMEHLSLNGLKATEKAVLSTVADSDKTRQLMLAAGKDVYRHSRQRHHAVRADQKRRRRKNIGLSD